MSRICILTDSTVQFPSSVDAVEEHVYVIPMHIALHKRLYTDGKDLKPYQLLESSRNGDIPRTLPPTIDEFREMYGFLGTRYNEVIVVLTSAQLNPAVHNALKAAEQSKGPIVAHVIDSQSTAIGMGYLVKSAAQAVQAGANSLEINRLIRGILPHVYTIFCLQSLRYLANTGYLDPAQAIIGEMLGVIPFFILENGKLVPIQKARSSRQIVDLLYEFICEFTDLEHIGILQGLPPYEQEIRNLRERVAQTFPTTHVSEHSMGSALVATLGPHSLSVFTIERNSPSSYS